MDKKQILEKLDNLDKLSMDEILKLAKIFADEVRKLNHRFEIKPKKSVNRRDKK